MVRDIVKDIELLSQKSERFIIGEDNYLIDDLIDTANHYYNECVGLACVQIGEHKRVIVVKIGGKYIPFINPVIIKKSKDTYTIKERCLSLDGERQVKRHRMIKVCYTTKDGKNRCEDYSGFIAQVIQHECDHLNGILI